MRMYADMIGTTRETVTNRLLSKRLANVEKEYGDFGHTWSYNRLRKVLFRAEWPLPEAGETAAAEEFRLAA